MTKSLHCVVKGRVQGVFFRAWVYDQAIQRGLAGWVRNLAHGPVEVLAQGDEQSLRNFKNLLRQGAPLSRVEDAQCRMIEHGQSYNNFQIR
jgi:acylphosphatase